MEVFKNINIMRLKDNQEIIQTAKNIYYFISYEEIIAAEADGVLYFTNLWNYSQTTTKYLYQFINVVYYSLNEETQEALKDFRGQTQNRKKAIEKALENHIIKYENIWNI